MPGDRRRQHDRQLDERDRERPALEPVRREEPGRRRPEAEDHDLRDRRPSCRLTISASITTGFESWCSRSVERDMEEDRDAPAAR